MNFVPGNIAGANIVRNPNNTNSEGGALILAGLLALRAEGQLFLYKAVRM